MKPNKKHLSLILIPSLLLAAGCQGSSTAQRDVYQNKEECVADWGAEDLCQVADQNQQTQAENEQRHHSGGGAGLYLLGRVLGPSYFAGSRSVNYRGQMVSPMRAGQAVSNIRVSKELMRSGSTNSTPMVSRGGFGSGSRVSSSSFGG